MSELRLLTPEDLAAMLQLKRRTVLDTFARQEGFPASVTGKQKPRWLYSDVVKFLKSKSAQNANNG